MLAGIFSAIAVIVASVIGAYMQNKTNESNERNIQSTNTLNDRLAGQANINNLEQWQRETRYNQPMNQVMRYRDAGINPALAMSQGGMVDAGNALAGKPAERAEMIPFQAKAPDISGISDAANIASQVNLVEAQTDNLRSQTAKTNSEIPNAAKEREKLDAEIKEIEQRIKESEANVNLAKATEGRVALQNMNDVLTAVTNYHEAMSRIDLNNSNKEYVDKQVGSYEVELNKRLEALNASIAQAKASEKLINEQAEQIMSLVKQGNAEFAAKYGNTPEEIKQALRLQYDAALNYYQQNVKDARLRNSLQPVLFWSDLITSALEPVSSFGKKLAGTLR